MVDGYPAPLSTASKKQGDLTGKITHDHADQGSSVALSLSAASFDSAALEFL
jgi:hypothetical protein